MLLLCPWNGHCRLVRVDDSTMCSETEHCLAGTGGRLNCVWTNLICIGCGGGPISVGLWILRSPIRIGLELWALVGVHNNWTIGFGCENQLGPSPIDFFFLLFLLFSFLTQTFNFCTQGEALTIMPLVNLLSFPWLFFFWFHSSFRSFFFLSFPVLFSPWPFFSHSGPPSLP